MTAQANAPVAETPRGQIGAQNAEFAARRAAANASRKRAELMSLVADMAATVIAPKAGGYANARTNRLNAYSLGLRGSPDLALDPTDLDNLRRSSQETVRNNPIARAVISCIVDMCAPQSMTFQARTSSPEYNALIEERFRRWWESQADYRGIDAGGMLLRQVMESSCVDGDVGVNLVYSDRGPQVQLVAGERIAGLGAGDLSNQHGVEHDKNGRVIGYRVFDWNRWGSLEFGTGRFMPAPYFILAKNWRHRRPGQTRGEPLLAGCLHLIEQLSELKAATLVAARIGACFAAIIMSENPAEKQAAMLSAVGENGDAPLDTDGQSNTQVIRPGAFMHLRPGEKIEQLKPEFPADALVPFIVYTLREIGADIGLPLELFMFDTTETTFYGGKAAAAQAIHQTIKTWQSWLREIMTRVFRFWSDSSVADGTLEDHPERDRHVWIAAPTPAYDEKEAVEVGLLKVAHNLMPKTELCQQLTGHDLEEVAVIRAAEVQRERALDITPPALPGSSAKPTEAQTSTGRTAPQNAGKGAA